MKVLTLHQPWASLIALGVKSIETRSWRAPESLIGQRFAIHAAARPAPYPLPVDDGGVTISSTHPLDDDRYSTGIYFHDGRGHADLPLGCIVATAVLDDCVPMVDNSYDHDGEHRLFLPNANGEMFRTSDKGPPIIVTAQLPYGDFRPGRWAWLLRDVEPVTEKCPKCRGKGWTVYTPAFFGACTLCGGDQSRAKAGAGHCDPIPFKGGQGLSREWTP